MGNPPRHTVVIARVRRPHGIRGKLLVEDLTGGAFAPKQGSELGFDLETGYETIKLAKIKNIPGGYIYSLEGYTHREQIDSFRNVYIAVEEDELPETDTDEYYYFELIGLPVGAWGDTEPGFWTYAARDPIATLLVAQRQFQIANQLIEPYRRVLLLRVDRTAGLRRFRCADRRS